MEERGYFVMDKVAKDNECLENDPPYMEIKRKDDPKDDVVLTDTRARWKKITIPGREEKSGLSWQLGAEYERKKQKLQQELRLEYRNFSSQDKDLNVGEQAPQPQDLSLPIGERRSAKNRLRDERNKEYNDFLRRRAGQGNIKRTSVTSQVPASETVCFEAPASPSPIPEAQPKLQSSRREHHLSRRDAATLTEIDRARGGRRSRSGAGTRAGAWGAVPRGSRRWDPYRAEESLEYWERRPRRRRGRREDYSSTEELYTEEEEQEEEVLDRRRPRQSKEIHYTGRRERRIHLKPERIVREQREVKRRVDREEDKREEIRKALSASSNHKLEMPASMRVVSERSRSAANKDKAEFATGLMIGAAEGEMATQMRKDRYREDLLEQMAEQQRNKKREKELELRVAATGAIDPEKQPDRIKQFGAVNRDYESRRPDVPYRPGVGLDALGTNPKPREEKPFLGTADRGPPDKPRVAFLPPPVDYSAALGQLAGGAAGGSSLGVGVPGVAPPNDNFHQGLSGTLGEMIAPRIAGVAPPLPPSLPNTFRTPYDEAYYYYGARNPLDSTLSYYGPPVGGVHPLLYPHMAPGVPPPPGLPLRSGVFPGLGVGMVPGERSHQSKESLLSYQEALRQQDLDRQQWHQRNQIQDREERRRRDREEKERYDAKLEAEMKAYDPWGRGGAGAPLRDATGNLISDLHRMHRTNEDAYINPESRNRKPAEPPPERSHPPPRIEEPSAPTVSGSLVQPSPFARGNVFTDKPTAQQLHDQDAYKDFLQKQIEEKRRKEAESRERMRREEEKEERRLAEQRALMQQEYELEQERKRLKDLEQSAKNEELIRQAEERRREAERRRKEEEEREAVRLQQERQSKQASLAQRVPSPPIPALQKKLNKQPPPRPPSSVSQLSLRTASEHSMSASHSPPVPARRNQLRAPDQPGVISELSAMRRRLLSERRRLEKQLEQTDRAEPDTPLPSSHRRRPPVDVFDMARLRAQLARRASSGAAPAVVHGNTQNIREFNQLKYRDSASREEVRQVYPDPPADERSLDIQQQALLREQQRTLRTLRQRGGDDVFEPSPDERQKVHLPREKPDHSYHRLTALGSDGAFIDCPKGKMSPVPVQSAQSSRQPSAQDRARSRARRPARRGTFLDELEPPDPRGERGDDQADAQSLTSATSLDFPNVRVHNRARIRRLDQLDDNWGTGGLSGDDGDNFSLQSSAYTPRRRVSSETVATEAWLRPGTSDTVKRGMAGRSRRDLPSLDQDWDGPSTYHG